ncbi:MAG: DUF3368 domain-containing protein [Bacteroidetes bacterium]|jgi:predicted nucleic acid-binding protein|nr:DUF3368 domain-containing protein [Bacteroidota bacterium]
MRIHASKVLPSHAPIVNASPLIFLSKGGYLELLRTLGDVVGVPEAVAAEIDQRSNEDVTVRALRETDWLLIVDTSTVPAVIQAWDLGPGESSVLALAYNDNREAIVDDRAARRCAKTLGIPVRGTLGIVLLAKKRGVIEAARPVVEGLVAQGMYLSKGVLDQALALVGE